MVNNRFLLYYVRVASFKNAVSWENFLLLKGKLQTVDLCHLSFLHIAVFSSTVAMPIVERLTDRSLSRTTSRETHSIYTSSFPLSVDLLNKIIRTFICTADSLAIDG